MIRAYVTAVLLFTPSLQLKSEANFGLQEELAIAIQQEKNESEESVENVLSYESIFKDGIKKALDGVDRISQIPLGGKHIDYYRDQGGLRGKKINSESIHVLKLPEKFDISPRNITKPVASMIFHLGNRKFEIRPDMGKIKDIYLTADKLVIESTLLFDISYDKETKLPDLMFRLWMTPGGKGEKKGFRGTTVVEI